ncbi:hypothetical protein RUND412_000572 [Rhizina undulata]
MISLPSLSFLYLIPLLYAASSRADCECGYYLTQTSQRYTHQLVNDFSKIEDTTGLGSLSRVLPDWEIETWAVGPDPSSGTVARQNDAANVWIQNGLLHLRERGHPDGDTSPDNSTETDIEILTKDNETTIHYTQHPAYIAQTDTLIPDATYQVQLDSPWTEFQEQRFDWMPGLTAFYETNKLKQDMRTNVPNHDGKIMMNLWSNNGSWSGKPSTTDVIMTVQYVIMYFNTTASDAGEDQEFNAKCNDAGGFNSGKAVCEVEDEPGIASSAPTLKTAAWHQPVLTMIGVYVFLMF